MSGLQNIPIRWPQQYDPAFFDRLFREVLANADVRNANAGSGITISGTPDDVATISAGQDVQDLIDSGVVTAADSGTDNARQLVAGEDGSIVITDNGAGGTIEVMIGEIQLTNLGPVADLSVLGVPTADDGFDAITTINSSANDTLLRRVSDVLEWGVLTPGMFPDATVSAWDSTEIEIASTLFDMNGNFDISGTLALGGEMTVPANWDLNIGSSGQMEIRGAGDFRSASFAASGAVTLYFNNGFAELPYLETTAVGVSVGGMAGLGATFSVVGSSGTGTVTTQHNNTNGFVQVTTGELRLAGGNGIVGLLRSNGAAQTLRIYDSAGTDYASHSHNGTDAITVLVNSGAWDISGAAQMELTGGMDLWIRDAGFLRIYDSTDTDYGQQSHDGTDYLWAFVTTRHLAFSGLTGSYIFDRPIRSAGFTVAGLPAVAAAGDRAHVTDALAPAFGAAVAGGGAITIPVFYDGAAWIVG